VFSGVSVYLSVPEFGKGHTSKEHESWKEDSEPAYHLAVMSGTKSVFEMKVEMHFR
jgi:hypothetical protein